jgi:hypothetical protein
MNASYKEEDFTNYYMQDVIPESRKDEWKAFFAKNNIYANAEFIGTAQSSIKKLSEKYEVFIVTAYVIKDYAEISGKVLNDKFNWLCKNLPFIPPSNFVFVQKCFKRGCKSPRPYRSAKNQRVILCEVGGRVDEFGFFTHDGAFPAPEVFCKPARRVFFAWNKLKYVGVKCFFNLFSNVFRVAFKRVIDDKRAHILSPHIGITLNFAYYTPKLNRK